ncbi:hypothetical protein V6N13_142191 [Hibiscus sabdariffa]
MSSSGGLVLASEGLSIEPLTPILLVFSHSSDIRATLAVYPPHGPNFGFNYGIVQHTPPDSLFATGLSGISARDDDEDDVETDEDEEENDVEVVRRNPRTNHRPPCCGTGGHRRY